MGEELKATVICLVSQWALRNVAWAAP